MKKLPGMMIRALLLGLPLLFFSGALPYTQISSVAQAAQATPGISEETRQILDKIASQGKKAKNIESRFRQIRYISFMDEELESTGFFSYQAPDTLIWQYDSPAFFRLEYKNGKATFQNDFDGESGGTRHAPRRNPREEELAAQIGRQIMLWISMDINVIETTYNIELQQSSPLLLRLTPRKKSTGPLSAIELLFEENGPEVRKIVLHDADGDYTRLEFHDSRRTEQE